MGMFWWTPNTHHRVVTVHISGRHKVLWLGFIINYPALTPSSMVNDSGRYCLAESQDPLCVLCICWTMPDLGHAGHSSSTTAVDGSNAWLIQLFLLSFLVSPRSLTLKAKFPATLSAVEGLHTCHPSVSIPLSFGEIKKSWWEKSV